MAIKKTTKKIDVLFPFHPIKLGFVYETLEALERASNRQLAWMMISVIPYMIVMGRYRPYVDKPDWWYIGLYLLIPGLIFYIAISWILLGKKKLYRSSLHGDIVK